MPRVRFFNAAWMLLFVFLFVGIFASAPATREQAHDLLSVSHDEVMQQGQVWRVVTYAFLTYGLMDLAFKVIVFYFLAFPLELVWGSWRFLTLFGISVVGGGVTGALMGQPLDGSWAPILTLMLVHGLLFPDSVLNIYFILPLRVRTIALIAVGAFLLENLRHGWLRGLALTSGMLCGFLYYLLVTHAVSWVRIAFRRKGADAIRPDSFLKSYSNSRLMDRARRIMKDKDAGRPLSDSDRAVIQELVQRADPSKDLCSPYSFSPDNQICPPCGEFGLCLRRYLERQDEKA